MQISAATLLAECVAARRGGADFPGIWNQILKGHPLVRGIPAQSPGNDNPVLEIHLLGGQRLIFDAAGGFSLG